jgi:hypothetical protein
MRCFAHRFDFVSVNIVSTNLVAGSGRCFRSFVGPSPRSTRPQSTRDIDGRESELSSFCRDRVELFRGVSGRDIRFEISFFQGHVNRNELRGRYAIRLKRALVVRGGSALGQQLGSRLGGKPSCMHRFKASLKPVPS